MILHLGVADPIIYPTGQTVAFVAEINEEKYGVMQHFFDAHSQEIAGVLAESVAFALENLMQGSPASENPFAGGESGIREQFNRFLDSGEIERMGIDGVPTQAAIEGKSKRLKRSRGAPRPSFIDSGMYESSFQAWIEQ